MSGRLATEAFNLVEVARLGADMRPFLPGDSVRLFSPQRARRITEKNARFSELLTFQIFAACEDFPANDRS